jgi:hypothetical protein
MDSGIVSTSFTRRSRTLSKAGEHMATDTDTKQHILDAFQQLFEARKSYPSRLAIREEVAEKEKDKRVVETASTYTAVVARDI